MTSQPAMKTPDLLCLGGLALDLLLRAPDVPQRDEKLVVEFAGRHGGGLVANAACAAAQLGLSTAWAGPVGDDEYGQVCLADFARFGVDTGFAVKIPGAATSFCVILLTPGGERTILVANTLPVPPPLSTEVRICLSQAPLVYTLLYQAGWFQQVAAQVHAGGGKVAVDIEASSANQDVPLKDSLQYADLVFCSASGLRWASGQHDLERGARTIQSCGPELVVVTLGNQGAFALSGAEQVFQPAYPAAVVDTTGAGDCFHAACLLGIRRSWSLQYMLRFASAAAALSVQAEGARGRLPDRPTVEEFLRSVGERVVMI
ncbi:MAG TPA: carbohydrate kinase family protein [Levilinea sp.]|nr:carbohydrate kinase family protein [Levilinea sp.]